MLAAARLAAVQKGVVVPTTTYASLDGSSGTYFTAPHSATLVVTGDLDIKVCVSLNDWTPAAESTLIAKWSGGTNGYYTSITSAGKCVFAVYSGGFQVWTTTGALGLTDGSVKWLRFTRVAATGVMSIYTGDDGTTWTLFEQTTMATGNISGTGTVIGTIGASSTGTTRLAGKVYRAMVLSGIDGTVKADFRPALVTRTAARTPSTYTDSAGNVWTGNGTGWDWV